MKNFKLTLEQVNGEGMTHTIVTGAATVGEAKKFGQDVIRFMDEGYILTTIVEV